MKITNKTTIGDAILILKNIDFQDQLDASFVKVEIPEITYGQRIDLSEIKTLQDLLFIPQKVLYNLTEDQVMYKSLLEVYNFGKSVYLELERLTIRDQKSFKYEPTSEEIKAGYNQVNHGVFGIVDTIARRMGIQHDDVFLLPEKRVFAMLKIDFDNMMYQKKLNKIISKQK